MANLVRRFGVSLLALLAAGTLALAQTSFILPNAKTQFLNALGQPLASGTVYTYLPNTTTPKTTWSDPFQTTPNSDPVVLDAGGSAFLFGAGNYTETLYDANNNLIWSGLTEAGGGSVSSTASGTSTNGDIMTFSGT